MIVLSVLTLCLLAALNYRLNGKSLFHPAVVFCIVWAFDLFVVWAVGRFFFPLSAESLLVFTFGALMFSVGAHIAKALPAHPRQPAEPNKTITRLLWVLAILFPFFIRWILQVAGEKADSPLLMALRIGLVDMEGESLVLTMFGTLIQVGIIIALIAYREKQGHSRRAWLAIALCLVMNVLTGTKGGPLAVVMGLMYINWLNTRKVRSKVVITVCLVFALIFTAVEYTVHQADSSEHIAENAALYISGGIVALDQVLQHPHLAPLANPVYDIFMRVLKRIGYHVEVVSAHGYQYVSIGPDGLMNNTYTIYGSWINLGAFAMVAAMLVVGFTSGLAYRRALFGGKVSAIFYAVYFPALFFSPFHDYTTTFIWLFLVLFLSWCVYYLPLKLARLREFTSSVIRADGAKPQHQGSAT
jgi:oligosaccharide repeat unit polymerase